MDFTYTGIAKNANGWWRIVNGKVDFGCNSVEKNELGWWYIRGGKVDFDYTGVAKNANGWWRIENGKVNFSFQGFADNINGWWYLKGGKVQFGTNSVIKGTVKGENAWWYVSGGQVIFNYNGIGINENGAWLIENGKVNFDFTGSKTFNGLTYHFTNGRTFDHLDGWQYVNGKSCYFKMACVLPIVWQMVINWMGTDTVKQGIWCGLWWQPVQIQLCLTNRKFSQSGTGWFITTGHTNVPMNICPRDGTGMLAGRMILQSSVSMIKRGIVINIHRCSVYGEGGYRYQVRVYHGRTKGRTGGTYTRSRVVNIGGTWYAYDIDFAKFNAPSSIYYHTPYSVTSKSIHFQGVGVNLY